MSPITIATTSVLVAKNRMNRAKIQFQNTGKKPIYLKKINSNLNPLPTVSSSDYDFILPANTGSESETILQIESVLGFVAVSENPNSTLAIMETIKL